MKKMYCFLLMLMVCIVFTACGTKSATAVSAKVLTEIGEKWEKENGREIPWDGENGYYGTYQGAVVFIIQSMTDEITKFTVADEEFVWYCGCNIYVYKDGTFLRLQDAYDTGWLTKKNIKAIKESHEEYLYTRTNWERPTK